MASLHLTPAADLQSASVALVLSDQLGGGKGGEQGATDSSKAGMRESTVSRVTSNKYMATPRGLFELKYFFTSAIASADGGEAYSAEAVRFRIKAMIESETVDDVMSDDKIVERLLADGVDIARRTVAKYREAMNIPSSVKRRRKLKGMN